MPNHSIPYKEYIRRFWKRVVKSDNPDACWDWIGKTFWDGYGNYKIAPNMDRAHRISYFLHFGEIPKGMLVCHRCDNPKCTNPKHLFLGTHSDNMRDCVAKGRLKIPKCSGERHGRAKITEQIVRKIRALYLDLGNQKEVAKRLKLPYSLTHDVLKGKTWQFVK